MAAGRLVAMTSTSDTAATAATSSGTEHVNVRSLPINAYVSGIYNLVNPQLGVTRNGDTYLKCLLRDATGEVPARRWRFAESDLAGVKATGFVWISGRTELYNDAMQLIIEEIRATPVEDADLHYLLPTTSRDIDAMFARVTELLGSLEHPAMRALSTTYLGNATLMALFRRAPAATALHHAWIGGLLEHTLQLMEIAERTLPLYPRLNRDLVLLGLFLHDLGKTLELSWDRGFSYTTDGNLVGHIVRGAIILESMAARAAREGGPPLPHDALRVLQHIILSHHGLPEHGAARIPSTPEAIFIAMLDNLDARTQMSLDATRPEQRPDAQSDAQSDSPSDAPADGSSDGGSDGAPAPVEIAGFTERIWALDTRLYRPDPLK